MKKSTKVKERTILWLIFGDVMAVEREGKFYLKYKEDKKPVEIEFPDEEAVRKAFEVKTKK